MKDKSNRFALGINSLLPKVSWPAVRTLLFFISFYLFLWLYIDTRLIIHGGGYIRYFPVFYKGWPFLKERLFYPGGFVEYLSAFLSQFLYYSWAGALVITLQAWLIYSFTNCLLKAFKGQQIRVLSYVPPILLLILYAQYTFYFTTIMNLTVALGFVCLTVKMNLHKTIQKIIVYIILSFIVYALAGGTFVVFALLCVMAELLEQRRWQIILTGILSIPLIPYIEGVLLYRVGPEEAFFRLTPLFWKFQLFKTIGEMYVYSLYLFYIFIMLVLVLRELIPRIVSQNFLNKLSKLLAIRNVTLKWILSTCLLFLLSALAVYLTFDSKRKALFEVGYYGYHHMWPQVIEVAKANPDHNLVMAAAGRALYHLDQLGSSPLTLKQNPATLLLISESEEPVTLYWFEYDLYLDLGFINKAEHYLVESLAFYGERPQLLQRLALVNLVKGNIGTAKIYLRTLNKMLFYSKWANGILGEIESDPTLASNEQVQHLRSLMLDQEHNINYPSADLILLDLLKKNQYNKMAFEYLMTCYMLTRDLEHFANNLYRFQDFNYPHIPRLFEETVLIIYQNHREYLKGKNFKISPESLDRCRSFNKASQLYTNISEAYRDFPDEFRDSYYFYYTFFNQIYADR